MQQRLEETCEQVGCALSSGFFFLGGGEKERERERERQTDRKTERKREREEETERD